MYAVEWLALVPILIFSVQAYNYAVAKTGEEKQQTCKALGIACATAGIVILAYRSVPLSFAGLFLIMMGLRLIAHGLDRIKRKYLSTSLKKSCKPFTAIE